MECMAVQEKLIQIGKEEDSVWIVESQPQEWKARDAQVVILNLLLEKNHLVGREDMRIIYGIIAEGE